ncbi:hypothetical protein [Tepidibacter aestuarii]|uniref:hypothetical protein n=1 Tax=Tepidibacter aestuarii TaxID=2925782 RepID=UPI0020C03911|nr:hypothetical protein [Tepidibacter aestuarii]CAH2212281.1 conserved exported protein of unknown function [Tepidibacter aestuarii]
MKASSRTRKLLSGILIGGTLLSSVAGVAFANELNNLNPTNKVSVNSQMNKGMGSRNCNFKQNRHGVNKDMSSLVEKGILTQEEADKIKDFQEQKRDQMQEATKDMTRQERFEYMQENRVKGEGFLQLVEEGILTQERANEIQDKMHQMKADLNKQKHEERVNKLVEDGIITQDEADKWMEFSAEKSEARQVEIEKIKDMTAEERKEYFNENPRQKGEGLTELVEAGIISQDTADKIKENHQNDQRGNRQGNGQRRGNGQGRGMNQNF